jgi:hypothetical protein
MTRDSKYLHTLLLILVSRGGRSISVCHDYRLVLCMSPERHHNARYVITEVKDNGKVCLRICGSCTKGSNFASLIKLTARL